MLFPPPRNLHCVWKRNWVNFDRDSRNCTLFPSSKQSRKRKLRGRSSRFLSAYKYSAAEVILFSSRLTLPVFYAIDYGAGWNTCKRLAVQLSRRCLIMLSVARRNYDNGQRFSFYAARVERRILEACCLGTQRSRQRYFSPRQLRPNSLRSNLNGPYVPYHSSVP